MTDSVVRPPRRAPRRLGAVCAGLLVVVIASTATDFALAALGVTPPLDPPWTTGGPFMIALGQRLVWQVAGAWLTARLAPDRSFTHAFVLGTIGFALAMLGALAVHEPGPAWYPWSLVASSLPCAGVGGWLGRPTSARV